MQDAEVIKSWNEIVNKTSTNTRHGNIPHIHAYYKLKEKDKSTVSKLALVMKLRL